MQGSEQSLGFVPVTHIPAEASFYFKVFLMLNL